MSLGGKFPLVENHRLKQKGRLTYQDRVLAAMPEVGVSAF